MDRKTFQAVADDEYEVTRIVRGLLRAGRSLDIRVLDDRGGNGGILVIVKPLGDKVEMQKVVPSDRDYEWKEVS